MEEYKENRAFFMNTAGISLVEFFWGLGLPLVLESTFLQLFLTKLGASNLMIGLVPTFLFTGQALLGVFSAYYSKRFSKQRTIVIVYHLFPSAAILVFGFYLAATGEFLPSTITIFFITYILFNAGIGFTMPVWQNYLVKLYNSEQVLPAFAAMMIFQSAGRLISSFLIAGYFTGREITAGSSASLFILCGSLFFIGSFGFFLTSEPETVNDDNHTESGFFFFLKESFGNIIRNRSLVFFLFSDIDMYAVIAVISFYAAYAVKFHGISAAAAAGIFVGLNYAGQILANFLFGTLKLLSMKGKCYTGRICSIGGIIFIIAGSGLPAFLAASVLLGISRASRNLIYAPAVKMLSGKKDATNYFAAAPILMLPLSTGIPVISGRLLDSLPVSGPVAFKIVFAMLGLLSVLSFFFIRRVGFSTGSAAESKSET